MFRLLLRWFVSCPGCVRAQQPCRHRFAWFHVLQVRWLTFLSGLESHSSRLYANLNHLNTSTSLTLRLSLRRFPIRLLSCASALILLMLSFAMQALSLSVSIATISCFSATHEQPTSGVWSGVLWQVAERRVTRKLDEFSNCVWLVLMSMSGVGFGDLVPQSLAGRMVGV